MSDEIFNPRLKARKAKGNLWMVFFISATLVGVLSLGTLLFSIMDQTFGLVAIEYDVSPEELGLKKGQALEELTTPELILIVRKAIEEGKGTLTQGLLSNYEQEKALPIEQWTKADISALIGSEVLGISVVGTWNAIDSFFNRAKIETQVAQENPEALVVFRSWVSSDFISGDQTSQVLDAGIRSAILGSLYTILIAILFAFPVGVGAAIYLQEYSRDTPLNRFIQTNIYNLAGVPSIIYGILGLAIFVRLLEPLTSGALFGSTDGDTANGRTILSAGLTLGILILPVIIINAQEAFKAVPSSLRQSAYAVGSTKIQMIWHHLLPASFDRVLTGTVLAVSRGIGETAPLVVVGASTFLTLDPSGPFSKFTVLPMQIYLWTSRPEEGYKNAAAAAILCLLVLLVSLNAGAILYRNHLRKKKDLG